MKFDWNQITSLAYQSIIELKVKEFPIPTNKIKCKGVKICSYQKYAEKTCLAIEKITQGNELKDAFLLMGLRKNVVLILYNKNSIDSRMKHTLWHEVGHIKCGHHAHGAQEEIEAHFFASQANAPNALIKEIAKRGYTIDMSLLTRCFGLSQDAAQKKIDYLNRHHFNHINEYDEILLMQFSGFINTKFPQKVARMNDSYYDEMEQERKGWY